MSIPMLLGLIVPLLPSIQTPAADPARSEPAATHKAERPDIYDASADAAALVQTARKNAARDRTHVLVMLGGNWCGWCHKLHQLFDSNSEIRDLIRDEYELVMVDTSAKGAEALMASWKVETNKGVPYLVVLGPDGSVVTRQETGALEEGDHHDPAKVKAFLSKNVAPRASASEALTAALATAEADGKRVFVHFGAPWCGWCHRLDDFLAQPEIAQWMQRDFVDLKIDVDRMTGGQDVLSKFRTAKDGGIPWMTILDAKGTVLTTSDSDKGNIGFPVEPHEIQHFMTMLHSTVRPASQPDLAVIEKALEKSARRIKAARNPAPSQ